MSPKNLITFCAENISFQLNNENLIAKWIIQSIENEKKSIGEICYIYCSDNYLLDINLKHLQHDTYTDVITFNYCEDDVISSDIFISIDRVKENAIEFNSSFEDELHRVMIHGILHLIGYDDKDASAKEIMRAKEDFYLTLLQN